MSFFKLGGTLARPSLAVDPTQTALFPLIILPASHSFQNNTAFLRLYYTSSNRQTLCRAFFCHPTFYVLPPLLPVFPEAESVAVAEPEVVVLVFAAAEPSPEVVVLAAEPEAVFGQPEVFALVFAAAELSPEVVALAAEPEVFAAVDLEVSEPGVVFVSVVSVALVSIADVAEPQASGDIALPFDVLVPLSVVAADVDSSGRPRFFSFPNIYYFANSSSYFAVVGKESDHSSTGARTSYALCSILSNPGLHQNKNLEQCYNNPSPGYNNGSDTNAPPIDATTNHPRKRGLHQFQEQRRHRFQVSLLILVVRQIQWAAAEKFQCLYLPLPSLE